MIDRDLARHLIQQTFLQRHMLDTVELTDTVVSDLVHDAANALLREQTARVGDVERELNTIWRPHQDQGQQIRDWQVSVGLGAHGLIWTAFPLAARDQGGQAVTGGCSQEIIDLVRAQATPA